ncbi:MAG: hypothetical protein RIM99_14465 [Cyclobacteriaceae bacterium]
MEENQKTSKRPFGFLRDFLERPENDVLKVMGLLFFFSLIGVACLYFPAKAKFLTGGSAAGWHVFAVGFFLIGASTLTGGFIGFLFGVPRKRLDEQGTSNSRYTPNTNLEQISDWLTKIIVGVSLVQAKEIASAVEGIGEKAGPAIAEGNTGEIIAIAIVIHYLFLGFIQGFLLAYLWLPGAFRRANPSSAQNS